jgi:alkanesulfonate monooxygenase SsuD/methylene tetrahydromethanopterin reductase-like flavin-dependent oxidoreductase (luciferase family)
MGVSGSRSSPWSEIPSDVEKRSVPTACDDGRVGAARQPRGIGFALRDPLPWDAFAGIARSGELLGYAAVFLPEIAGRDALAALAGLAGETRELLLGTGVVPMGARRTMVTAMGAATVHERSGGRLILGLGTGAVGRGALDRLREQVHALRSLFAGEVLEVDGERERLTLDPGSRVPVWLAALGPRAMRLAGEVADGVLLNWCPPERVAFARERIREGAEANGRDPAEITVAVYVRACVAQDEGAALAALRVASGQYAAYPAYARQLTSVGLGAEADRAAAAHRAATPEEVPERLVRELCLLGGRREARRRLGAYREAGADLPVVYPVPVGEPAPSILGTLLALAPSERNVPA